MEPPASLGSLQADRSPITIKTLLRLPLHVHARVASCIRGAAWKVKILWDVPNERSLQAQINELRLVNKNLNQQIIKSTYVGHK